MSSTNVATKNEDDKIPKRRARRHFNPAWKDRFGLLQKDEIESICTLCHHSLVTHLTTIRKHYYAKHRKIDEMDEADRLVYVRKCQEEYLKMYCEHARNQLAIAEENRFPIVNSKKRKRLPPPPPTTTSSNDNEIIDNNLLPQNDYHEFVEDTQRKASYMSAIMLAKKGKPFSDSNFFKEYFLEIAEILFTNFTNKAKIIDQISKMVVSTTSIQRRFLEINDNIDQQLREDLQQCDAISLKLDQIVNRNDVAQLSVSFRFYSRKFQRFIEEICTVGSIGCSKSLEDTIAIVEKISNQHYSLCSKLFSICIAGSRKETAELFVQQLQQKLNRTILVFDTTIQHQQTLASILKDEPIRQPIELLKTFKFLLYPELYTNYHQNTEYSIEQDYFKYFYLSDIQPELVDFCISEYWCEKFQQLRQELLSTTVLVDQQTTTTFLNRLTEVWSELPRTSFRSMKIVANCLLSTIGSVQPKSSKSKQTLSNNTFNVFRNRLKTNNTEACIRLQTTNYVPDLEQLTASKNRWRDSSLIVKPPKCKEPSKRRRRIIDIDTDSSDEDNEDEETQKAINQIVATTTIELPNGDPLC